MDNLIKNPPPDVVTAMIEASEQKAAKWIRDTDTGNQYYFPAERYQHMEVAYMLKLRDYTKGIEVKK